MIYVMSDIHGYYDRFMDVLDQINLQPDDHLYVLGDVIDRLPDGLDILQYLMKIPNATLILGNHEHMMLDSFEHPDSHEKRSRWFHNGGGITRDAFYALPLEEGDAILDYIRGLPVNIEITVNGINYLLVHGAPLDTYDPYHSKYPSAGVHAIWHRLDRYSRMPKGKTVIFGHTPTIHYHQKLPMRIWYGDHMIGIDCGCATSEYGRLACLRLDDMKEYYSSTSDNLTE